jgi:Zn finger protein HypA/HybF involved in hydrogenase expression
MSIISDLVNIEEFEKKDDFKQERWKVSFYCKDCNKIVETDRLKSNAYIFVCKTCKRKNIVIWTYEWLKTTYKIKD